MPRSMFDQDLKRLHDEILSLGSMVENVLIESVELLKRRDLDGARRIILTDKEVNRRRFAIESEALTLIATQQPMAGDLRMLAAILDIASELERIGDYAKGIARINLMIGDQPLVKTIGDISLMAEKANHMLHQALTAFTERDVDLAARIPIQDDEVDALYNKVYRDLIATILSDPHAIDQTNYLLWAAHNLERAADRVTNICERVIFTVTGKMREINADDFGSVQDVPRHMDDISSVN
jgi:phosphate transport system protein